MTAKPLDDLKGYWWMRTQRMAFAGRESGGYFKSRRSMMAWTRTKSLPTLGRAISLAGGCYAAVNVPVTTGQGMQTACGQGPNTSPTSSLRASGPWNRSCCKAEKNDYNTPIVRPQRKRVTWTYLT